MSSFKTPRRGVCLNVHGAQNADFWDRGIARYIVEHCRALVAVAPEEIHTIRASPDLGFTPALVTLLASGRVRRTHDEPCDADSARPALYHVMSPLEWGHPIDDIWPLWARDPSLPLVVTLYDLIPHLFPERYNKRAEERVAYDARLELVRRADHVLAISAHTAEDAMRELGTPESRITVIDAASSSTFLEAWPQPAMAVAHVRERFPAIAGDFAFYVGGMDERKNLPRLIEAWSRVSPEVRATTRLVITCELRPDANAELSRQCARQGLADWEVVFTGRVSDHDLAALYRACRLFIFASLYEGSGLPILEAMTAEAPVVAASTSTGPEILGESDGTFDPSSADEMAEVIDATLRDEARLERYRQRSRTRIGHFSWSRVADRTLDGYTAALARRRPARGSIRRARPRVALLCPSPNPVRGASLAMQRLATTLGEVADVDVVHGVPGNENDFGPSRYELRRGMRWYDKTIHVLGGSPGYRHAYEALIRNPGGVVLFEDVRLGGFHRWYGTAVGHVVWSRRQLDQQYGTMLPGGIALRGAATAEEATTLGLLFTVEVQAHASALLVPCTLAGDLLRVDRRGRELAAPIRLVAPPAPHVTSPRGRPRPLVVTAEPAGSPGTELLVRALPELTCRVPGATLALLGGASEADRSRLAGLAARLGVEGALSHPTRLTRDARFDLIRSCAIGVLAEPAIDWERIAFAGECQAAGIPVVAPALGWAAESPDGTVEQLAAEPTSSEMARRVAELLSDASRATRIGDAGRQRLASGRPLRGRELLEAVDLS